MEHEDEPKLLPITQSISQLLYGPMAHLYIREAVSACREANATCVSTIIKGLVHASIGSTSFTDLLMKELLKQYNSVSSGELKNLSAIFIDLLVLSDALQFKRVAFAVDGDEDINGLLTLVDKQQNSDSCRAYQCIKTLVAAANRSSNVKEKLLLDPEKWQWAVNWLKEKMDQDNQSASTAATGDSSINLVTTTATVTSSSSGLAWDNATSNEDSLSRNFHRTTSAVLTLQEANSILADFDNPSSMLQSGSSDNKKESQSMEVDEEEEEEMPFLLDMKE